MYLEIAPWFFWPLKGRSGSDYDFCGTVFTQKEGNIHFWGLFDSEVVVLVLVGLHSNVIQFGGHSPCQKYGDFLSTFGFSLNVSLEVVCEKTFANQYWGTNKKPDFWVFYSDLHFRAPLLPKYMFADQKKFDQVHIKWFHFGDHSCD